MLGSGSFNILVKPCTTAGKEKFPEKYQNKTYVRAIAELISTRFIWENV
jgi:hypothetical protein